MLYKGGFRGDNINVPLSLSGSMQQNVNCASLVLYMLNIINYTECITMGDDPIITSPTRGVLPSVFQTIIENKIIGSHRSSSHHPRSHSLSHHSHSRLSPSHHTISWMRVNMNRHQRLNINVHSTDKIKEMMSYASAQTGQIPYATPLLMMQLDDKGKLIAGHYISLCFDSNEDKLYTIESFGYTVCRYIDTAFKCKLQHNHNPLKYILNGQDKWTDILILDENNYLHNSTPHIGDNKFTKINYNELKDFEQHAITDNHYSIIHTG